MELADVCVSERVFVKLDGRRGGMNGRRQRLRQPYILPLEAKQAVREALDVEKYVRHRLGMKKRKRAREVIEKKESIGSKILSWFSRKKIRKKERRRRERRSCRGGRREKGW